MVSLQGQGHEPASVTGPGASRPLALPSVRRHGVVRGASPPLGLTRYVLRDRPRGRHPDGRSGRRPRARDRRHPPPGRGDGDHRRSLRARRRRLRRAYAAARVVQTARGRRRARGCLRATPYSAVGARGQTAPRLPVLRGARLCAVAKWDLPGPHHGARVGRGGGGRLRAPRSGRRERSAVRHLELRHSRARRGPRGARPGPVGRARRSPGPAARGRRRRDHAVTPRHRRGRQRGGSALRPGRTPRHRPLLRQVRARGRPLGSGAACPSRARRCHRSRGCSSWPDSASTPSGRPSGIRPSRPWTKSGRR